MANRAFIGIGTNLGDRLANYREAIERIGKLPQTRLLRQSSIYETEPVGDGIRAPFLNGAVEVETEMNAEAMMRRLLAIERTMGRKRVPGRKAATRGKYKSRIIDLDLLLFNKETISTRSLKVPHPLLHERRFVLAPLSELAPAFIHPQLNLSISEMLAGLKSPYRVSLMRADLIRSGPARAAAAPKITLPRIKLPKIKLPKTPPKGRATPYVRAESLRTRSAHHDRRPTG